MSETAALARDPLASAPDRTTLVDESGAVVLVFSVSESIRDAVPWAYDVWVPPGVVTARAAELARVAMPGWKLSTSDPSLVAALRTAGAQEPSHAHVMTIGLTGPPGTRIASTMRIETLTRAQIDRHAYRLAAITVRAYPEGHPDAFDGDEAAAVSQIRAIARGEMLGPVLPESRIALVDGEIVGACLVVDRSGSPPYGGPWVVDLFRDPCHPARGVGTALLASVVEAVRAAGLLGLSLQVNHDNAPARRLYCQVGFRAVNENWTLTLPAENERPAT